MQKHFQHPRTLEEIMLPPGLACERERILRFFLTRVPSEGWTESALESATIDAGYEETMARRAFPRGVNDLVATFLSKADAAMLAGLRKCNLSAMPIRDRIKTAVKLRIEQNSEHREAVRRLIALQSTPQYLVEALSALYKTVDSIWRAADDKSTDFNFYTKRGLLTGIYCSTSLFWLNDYSTGSTETWHFLDQRISDVMNLQKVRVNIEENLKRLEPGIAKFFQTLSPRT